jgi:cytochrome P450
MLLEVQSQEGLGEEQILHILAMLIGAGADSTSSVLQGFFKIMALQPEAMSKAREGED